MRTFKTSFLSGTFDSAEITHVEGEVDPIRDLDIINEELRLKDMEYFMKIYEEVERKYCRGGEKKLKAEYVRQFYKKKFVSRRRRLCRKMRITCVLQVPTSRVLFVFN